ncbi:MAG: tetratricopeptide repeat protein [bacterium]
MPQPQLPPGFIYKSELGSGGTARVVSVTREKHHRVFALKLPLPESENPEKIFAKLARREWQLIGGLYHPGLVRLLEISTDPNEYISMEICQGPTLDTIGKIENNLSAVNIFSALAINLEFLRLQGIVHGDLKAQNFFLPSDWESISKTNRLFFTKLSDFSLGKFVTESDNYRLGVGTVGYLAPETISENITSFRSDLFALGIIAYQMFTGTHPFMENESDPVKINSRCREEEPVPVKILNPVIDDDISAVIEKLLAKNPDNRPQSGWEVCLQLEAAGSSYPFRKALRPSASLNKILSYEENLKNLIDVDTADLERLSIICNNSNDTLHLILSHNFDKKNLSYDNNNLKFKFKNTIFWPNILRNHALGKYSQQSISGRKKAIKAAITGSIDNGIKLNLVNNDDIDPSLKGSVLLLKQFISLPTIKRFSSKYALTAERKEHFELAANLFLQAGELLKAADCAYQAAINLHAEHKSSDALKITKRVIDFANTSGKAYEIRRTIMSQGDIQKDMGEIESAFSTYKSLITLYKDYEPDKILAETYKDLGDLYKVKHQFKEGIEALNQALEIYYLLDDELEISHTLNNMGNIYWIASDLNKAIFNYRKALKIQRRLKAHEDIASTLNNIASIYALKGNFKRGIRLLNLTLNLKKDIGNKVEIARTLNNLGYCYYCCGDQYQAVNSLTESLELNRQVGNKKEILYNLENLTALMITAGQLRESLKFLKEGIAIANQVGDKNHFAIFQLSMATVLRRMGQFGQAEKTLIAIENIVKSSDDKSLKVLLMNARAPIRLAIGDYEIAEGIIKEAISLAEEIDNRPEILNSLLMMTKINYSPDTYQQAIALTEELALAREKVLLKNNLLGINLNSINGTDTHILVEEIEATLSSMNEDVEVSGIYSNLTEYYLINNNYDKAVKYNNLAMQKATVSNLIPELIRIYILTGKLKMITGEYEECFDNYKKGMKLTQQVSTGLLTDKDKLLFQNHKDVHALISEINKLKEQTVH